MAEEKTGNDPSLTSEDVDMLRLVLHAVRGISPISSVTANELPKE
jgi:hypothetical protein